MASIREQLSVAYAAIDDKPNSDKNRNIYLDLQEQTRQDRSLEARAGQLEQASAQLNLLIWAVVVVCSLMLLLFYACVIGVTRQRGDDSLQQQEEELREQLAMARLHVEEGERSPWNSGPRCRWSTASRPSSTASSRVSTSDDGPTGNDWSISAS